mmetsp:Transcript_15122/g.42373  ORF Transcript_15122/g.42373 Transcript_15122/m.42373 type:complete len:238 (-) Transcript_15122:261-974(-)
MACGGAALCSGMDEKGGGWLCCTEAGGIWWGSLDGGAAGDGLLPGMGRRNCRLGAVLNCWGPGPAGPAGGWWVAAWAGGAEEEDETFTPRAAASAPRVVRSRPAGRAEARAGPGFGAGCEGAGEGAAGGTACLAEEVALEDWLVGAGGPLAAWRGSAAKFAAVGGGGASFPGGCSSAVRKAGTANRSIPSHVEGVEAALGDGGGVSGGGENSWSSLTTCESGATFRRLEASATLCTL